MILKTSLLTAGSKIIDSKADPETPELNSLAENPEEFNNLIEKALQTTGAKPAPVSQREAFQQDLSKVGVNRQFCAVELHNIIRNTDSDSTKLRAIEKVLQILGVAEIEDTSKANQTAVQIVFHSSDNSEQLVKMVNPKRS